MTLHKVHEIFMVANLKKLLESLRKGFFASLCTISSACIVTQKKVREKVLDKLNGLKFAFSSPIQMKIGAKRFSGLKIDQSLLFNGKFLDVLLKQ